MTQVLKTVALGFLGLVVAAALGYLALELVSQPVGLNSQPVTAGDELVPASGSEDKTHDENPRKPKRPSSGTGDDASNGGNSPAPDSNGANTRPDDDSGGDYDDHRDEDRGDDSGGGDDGGGGDGDSDDD